jgi:hypothetical protein
VDVWLVKWDNNIWGTQKIENILLKNKLAK